MSDSKGPPSHPFSSSPTTEGGGGGSQHHYLEGVRLRLRHVSRQEGPGFLYSATSSPQSRDSEFYGCVPDSGAPRTREHQYSGPLLGHHEILATADGETVFSWPWTQLA